MYVCLCHGFTDHKVKELTAAGTCSATQVYRHFGVRPRCGKCVPSVRDMVRDGTAEAAPSDQGCGGVCRR